MPKDWEQFRIDPPFIGGYTLYAARCAAFSKVAHVSHLESSYRILKDDNIRAGLVPEAGKLRTKRLRVVWFSPNYWNDGSIYGNVKHSFDFASLYEGRQAYWVESVNYPNSIAVRFLITDRDYTGDPDLVAYDPKAEQGPWRQDPTTGQHYYREDIGVEFMYEGDVALPRCKKMGFYDHHKQFCNMDYKCPHLGRTLATARLYFLATLLGQRLPFHRNHFTNTTNGIVTPDEDVKLGYDQIIHANNAEHFYGNISATDEGAEPMTYAALSFLGAERFAEHRELVALFRSKGDYIHHVQRITKERFQLTNENSLNILQG